MAGTLGLALVAALALSAFAASSASASGLQWFSCNNVGGESGSYTDSACQTKGKGSYNWVELGSAPTAFGLEGTAPFTVTATIGGQSAIVSCSNAQASGSLANPSGEKPGTLSTSAETSLSLTGCSIINPKTGKSCPIATGAIPFTALSGEATELGGSPAVKVQPAEGTTLATFKVEPGECGYKASFNSAFAGSFTAVVNAANSSLEVSEAGSKTTFKANGGSAILNATARIETAAKQGLKLGVAAPVNTALPSSPVSPTVGAVVTTNSGSWLHLPVTYTYQWKRCTLAGTECKAISGATKSTYTPGQFDEAHKLVVEVVATNPGGSTSASSLPSGVVEAELGTPLHWYVCQNVGAGGSYSDAGCTNSEVPGNYELVKLTAGTPTSFTSTNLTPMRLSMVIGGATTTIECSTESGSGTVLNPTGGGAGTLTGTNKLLAFSGCKVVTGCATSGATIGSVEVTGKTTEGKIAFTVAEGLFTYTLSKCFAGSYDVRGTLNGTVSSSYSSLVFNGTSGSELKNGGANTWLEGSIQLKTAEGGLLRFKP